jgi:hypothetical protein
MKWRRLGGDISSYNLVWDWKWIDIPSDLPAGLELEVESEGLAGCTSTISFGLVKLGRLQICSVLCVSPTWYGPAQKKSGLRK